MKTILVATDFSSTAMNAIKYAADMALSINADLYLVHILQMPVSYTEIPIITDMEEFQQNAEDELSAIKETVASETAGKLFIETEVITGSFYEELKDLCEKISPYAVVLGSQGTSASERLIFGGHTVYAMTHLMWPLITVPFDVHFSSVKNIALACDFDEPGDTIPIDEIVKMVKDFHARLHIINTGRKGIFNPEIVFQSGQLQERLLNLKPAFHFITGKNTNDSILNFVERNQIDLLIVMPKRYGLLETIVHKSHTRQFVLHSHVPVMALQL